MEEGEAGTHVGMVMGEMSPSSPVKHTPLHMGRGIREGNTYAPMLSCGRNMSVRN